MNKILIGSGVIIALIVIVLIIILYKGKKVPPLTYSQQQQAATDAAAAAAASPANLVNGTGVLTEEQTAAMYKAAGLTYTPPAGKGVNAVVTHPVTQTLPGGFSYAESTYATWTNYIVLLMQKYAMAPVDTQTVINQYKAGINNKDLNTLKTAYIGAVWTINGAAQGFVNALDKGTAVHARNTILQNAAQKCVDAANAAGPVPQVNGLDGLTVNLLNLVTMAVSDQWTIASGGGGTNSNNPANLLSIGNITAVLGVGTKILSLI